MILLLNDNMYIILDFIFVKAMFMQMIYVVRMYLLLFICTTFVYVDHTIEFEQLTYNVDEYVGMFEVVLRMSDLVPSPFTVQIITTDGLATGEDQHNHEPQ